MTTSSVGRRPLLSQSLDTSTGGQRGAGEGALLNLLAARAERKDTVLYAHATAETQVAITDKHAYRPESRGVAVTANPQEPGWLEVFPRVASRPPRLLQELEALLVERLRLADKAACTSMLLPKDRDPGMATNLALDAHRQVFAAFVQGFSTYTGLLSRIQREFELTLAEGLRSAAENIEIRKRMAANAEKQATCEQEERSKVLASELEFRRAAFATLMEVRERTTRLSKRAAAVEKDLSEAKAQEDRLQQAVAALQTKSATLASRLARETAWAAGPHSPALQKMVVGPLTPEDAAFLEAEYTSQLASASQGDNNEMGPSGASSGQLGLDLAGFTQIPQ